MYTLEARIQIHLLMHTSISLFLSAARLNPVWIVVIVEAGAVLLLIVVIIELARKKTRSSSSMRSTSIHNNATAGIPDEEQPIFRPDDPSYRTYNAAETS